MAFSGLIIPNFVPDKVEGTFSTSHSVIMHDIEPYYNWRNLYIASEDEFSPFFGREYSEFEFTSKVYNYLIHPQWDYIGSETLYIKILFVDYDAGYSIIEMIGEWNDCLYNDIMFLYRNVIELMIERNINKFILIGENVLNFHFSDTDYYQEWFESVEDGWIAALNFQSHVIREFELGQIDYYLAIGGKLDNIPWRTMLPQKLFLTIEFLVTKRLGM